MHIRVDIADGKQEVVERLAKHIEGISRGIAAGVVVSLKDAPWNKRPLYVYCHLAGEVLVISENETCEICEGDCEISSDIIMKALNAIKHLGREDWCT